MTLLFLLTIDMGRQDSATNMTIPRPSSTRGSARASGQHAWGLSAMDRHYQHQGPQEYRHSAPGTMGHNRRRLRTPDSMYSGA
jgi:hypothetical protein